MASEAKGRGFESRRARQSLTKLGTSPSFLFSMKPIASAKAPVPAGDDQFVPIESDLLDEQPQAGFAQARGRIGEALFQRRAERVHGIGVHPPHRERLPVCGWYSSRSRGARKAKGATAVATTASGVIEVLGESASRAKARGRGRGPSLPPGRG